MYIKKKDRELFKEIDDNLTMPSNWNDFIKEKSIMNRYIIKNKKEYCCNNCKTIFESSIKVNDYCKCPHCKNTYIVKSNKLTFYQFKNDLAILEKYKDYFIVRMFRLETTFQNNKYKNFCYEYGRRIYDSKFNLIEEIVNDNVIGAIGGMYIKYHKKSNNWRYFRSWYCYLPDSFNYYQYNLKELLMSFESLKYSQLWELVKYVNCDLIYLIKQYNPSVEILTKMKLYNLALCPKTFKNKFTFEERFKGLSKDYLPFIQENNLTIDELTILSYLKFKDINYIRKFSYMSEDSLIKLDNIINLKTLIDKTNFDKNKYHEYIDYLDLAEKLKLNIRDKGILYPKDIIQAHDKLLKEYELQKDKKINNKIKKKCKELQNNIFEKNEFVIFPAKDLEALIDESSQQDNCVRTYAEKIASGLCEIYFMRNINNKDKSLVTVEVKNHKVVQKRTKHNGVTTKIQNNFLNIWEQTILNK